MSHHDDVCKIIDGIKPLLAPHEPEVIGAVLVDLVAMFVAGHEPEVRDKVMEIHVRLVHKLVPVIDKIIELEKKARAQPN